MKVVEFVDAGLPARSPTYKVGAQALAAATSATGLIATVFNGVEGRGNWFVQT